MGKVESVLNVAKVIFGLHWSDIVQLHQTGPNMLNSSNSIQQEQTNTDWWSTLPQLLAFVGVGWCLLGQCGSTFKVLRIQRGMLEFYIVVQCILLLLYSKFTPIR